MKIKAYFSVILLLTCFHNSFSQKNALKAEIGIFGGGAYYMGDINPERHFYSPQLAIGGLFRQNFNSRYALKLRIANAKLRGHDKDFNNEYQQIRDFPVQTNLTDFSLHLEFNFLPLEPGSQKKFWSPYVAGGIGAFLLFNEAETVYKFSVPFGLGVKISPLERMTIGIEWTMHKTFYDKIDGLQDFYTDEYEGRYRYKQKSFSKGHNDYYSIAGLYITYKFFSANYTCPAFAKPFPDD
jgi:hypothetical protein